MKKVFWIFIVMILIQLLTSKCQATNSETSIDTNAILEEQQETLDISSFLEEVEKYTSSVYEDIDMSELFSSALTGSIDNEKLFKGILNLLGEEVTDSITVLR